MDPSSLGPGASSEGIPAQSLGALFRRFLGFGLVAWGGPVAQIAMLRRELVDRERWISSERFNRTLAVYQALPGPEAHELCVYFGYLARGRLGGIVAGLGFMLPGLLLMLAASWFYMSFGIESVLFAAVFAGCQAAVLALIVRAVLRIGGHAITDWWLATIAAVAFLATIVGVSFVAILVSAGLLYLLRKRRVWATALIAAGTVAVTVSFLGSVGPPAGASGVPSEERNAAAGDASPAELLTSGLRAGLLTFGGAYTAIPFLEHDAVDQGRWMSGRTFLDGVALSGILPAPLIIFATFVGYVGGGLAGALVMTVGVFAPAFSFTLIGHRHLERLVEHRAAHAFLDGVTAGVVGLIAGTAVLLIPTAIRGIGGAAIFAVAVVGLYVWRSGAAIAMVMIGSGILGLVVFGLLGLTG